MSAILPRFIRYRDAPEYLGMDRNRFDAEVRPHLTEIPIGVRGIAYDRHDLDAWRNDEPGRRRKRAREARRSRLHARAEVHCKHRARAVERWRFAARLPRHQLRLLATPPWADRRAIAAVYEQAAHLSRTTGVPHHVDHEIPLQGEFVTGLHVHTNLRPLPAIDNLRKSNRYKP